ncbi:Glycoside hydrolase family 76 protein [Mycena venus]|uniref:Glycoside hydrolase family 76 protein n=1 Tax=Mycena venus TaxID=2733690 RepID=A0A8H6YX34_9AGAR|nr:Glycoside hydrolase family 76 protein [Mycena venus]
MEGLPKWRQNEAQSITLFLVLLKPLCSQTVDMTPLFISTALLLPLRSLAQQASSSWRKPNITTSRDDRVSVAEAAIEKALVFIDATNGQFSDPGDSYGLGGTLYSQLAEFDLATNQTKYADVLQRYFLAAGESLGQYEVVNFTGDYFGIISPQLCVSGGSGFNTVHRNYGHAAALAYTTYKIPAFLQYAEQVWWAVNSYTLSQKEVDAGTLLLKSFALKSTCSGITMAGGTFRPFGRREITTTPDMNAAATGGFLVLSALLAEATHNIMYLSAAKASADFLQAHLLNVQNVVQDTISGRANDSCALLQKTVEASYNSGIMIEGLAILYSITGNTSLYDQIGKMVTAGIPYSGWQSQNGIIANGATKSGDMFFVRALATVNARNAATPALQSYISAYLAVQFNAVIDLATTKGSNIYANSWVGPPSLSFAPGNQTNAIQVLIGAINSDNVTTPSTAPSGSVPSPSASNFSPLSPPPPHKSSSHVGTIVGGTLGGLALLGILVGILLWRRCRAQQDRDMAIQQPHSPEAPRINPFDLGYRLMADL